VLAHVSLVGGGGERQMIFDKCWHETRDGGQFLTAFECSEECC
jgi:precorrin-6B methylase 2